MSAQYCPHHSTCLFYQNFKHLTGNKRTDVIAQFQPEGSNSTYYDCLALIFLKESKTGKAIDSELRDRISNPNGTVFNCSHITLLNRLQEISTIIKPNSS
ncbi:MAG: hypothetical protein ABSG05_00250 [Candidatus Pacearchaeota archaeon]|jgi:hypothetical protein